MRHQETKFLTNVSLKRPNAFYLHDHTCQDLNTSDQKNQTTNQTITNDKKKPKHVPRAAQLLHQGITSKSYLSQRRMKTVSQEQSLPLSITKQLVIPRSPCKDCRSLIVKREVNNPPFPFRASSRESHTISDTAPQLPQTFLTPERA